MPKANQSAENNMDNLKYAEKAVDDYHTSRKSRGKKTKRK